MLAPPALVAFRQMLKDNTVFAEEMRFSDGKLTERGVCLALMTTWAVTLNSFFRWQSEYLSSRGYDIHWISSSDVLFDGEARRPRGVDVHHIPLHRRITPGSDLSTVLKLVFLLRRLRPTIIHTHTPKAGLIGMLAARLAGVPVRIFTINGRPSDTAYGITRRILLISEFISCAFATNIMCVSRSLESIVAKSQPLLSPTKFHVIHCGSSHGVDTEKFDVKLLSPNERLNIRRKYGIEQDAVAVGFIGRLVADKGITELAEAWNVLRAKHRSIVLLICGPEDQQRSKTPACVQELRSFPEVIFVQERPEEMAAVYASIDICVLPSHREGLPNVLLEAGAMSLPVVATRIPGCIDVVRHEETGLLVGVKDSRELADALDKLIVRPDLREAYGQRARQRIKDCFSQHQFIEELALWYKDLLTQ